MPPDTLDRIASVSNLNQFTNRDIDYRGNLSSDLTCLLLDPYISNNEIYHSSETRGIKKCRDIMYKE